MSFLLTAASSLDEVQGARPDAAGGLVLFDADGVEVGRAGCPGVGDLRWADGRVEGLPAEWSFETCALEGYGSRLGALVWLQPQGGEAPNDQTFRDLVGRLFGQLGTLDYEVDNLSRELAETYESVHLLCDVTAASARATSAEELCAVLLEHLVRQVKCRAGAILLETDRTDDSSLQVVAAYGEAESRRGGSLPQKGTLAEVLVEERVRAAVRPVDLGGGREHDAALAEPTE